MRGLALCTMVGCHRHGDGTIANTDARCCETPSMLRKLRLQLLRCACAGPPTPSLGTHQTGSAVAISMAPMSGTKGETRMQMPNVLR